jgi:glutathione synthase
LKHILFIDPIEKLNIKKDSTLMVGIALYEKGEEVYLLFEKDFYLSSKETLNLDCYRFTGAHAEDGYYLKDVEVDQEPTSVAIDDKTLIHMRIDPPYDIRYHRYLWMLDFIEYKFKARITNNPVGIMRHNEKLVAIKEDYGVDSFVGASESGFLNFVKKMQVAGAKEIVLKPMDLYSGIGVRKFPINETLLNEFRKYVKEYQGAVLAQPFLKEVLEGEHRSLFYRGEHLGTIIKKPVDGSFITNIAQGAAYEEAPLSQKMFDLCQKISNEMTSDGVDFIAFDILGDSITEMNVTCPGLVVEVSYACKKNIAHMLADYYAK